MSNLARTIRTLRHCRLDQLCWRLRYRLEARRPAKVASPPPGIKVRDDIPRELYETEFVGEDAANAVVWLESMEQGNFTHLNETRRLGTESVDWLLGSCENDRLWTVTLHYHRWAWRLAQLVKSDDTALSRRADTMLRRLLNDWITRCPLTAKGSRALAWNAYATATRISHWCRLYHLLANTGRENWGDLEERFLASLWTQADYLSRHLEWDLRGNHLLRDALGLVWAGRFFKGSDAKRWLTLGTELADQQAAEQVLPDAGHFERSPMYHVEIMDDFVTLALLFEQENIRAFLRQTWQSMAELLAWVRHPDGQVPLFNDGGLNGSPSPAAMFAKGKKLLNIDVDGAPRAGGKWFRDFGLIVWHGQPWSLFFDVGPVGIDYQPGHAHADTLAFEASYKGQRVFVDPGTFRYDNDPSRRYDRATCSHNTVAIDDTDSSEVWHIFRVGRRACPLDVEFTEKPNGLIASASHDGYDHLAGQPRHRRSIEVEQDGHLTITDHFEGQGKHLISGGMLIAPEWEVESTHQGWILKYNGRTLLITVDVPDALHTSVDKAVYHPEYGIEQPTQRLCWHGTVEFPSRMIIHITSQEAV